MDLEEVIFNVIISWVGEDLERYYEIVKLFFYVRLLLLLLDFFWD